MVHHHAHVLQHISDPLQIVVPNVQSIQNVQVTKLVYKKNVEILVSDLVVSMRFVMLSIIPHLALAQS